MAKGGGKKRTYVRDGNGRFASTPGGGKPALKGGTLTKRSSLKNSRAKLKAKDAADPSIRNTLSTRSQKGAVTRGNKALRAAKASSQRTAVGRSKVGTVAKAKRSPVLKTTVLKPEARVPASQRPGSMTSILRATMGALAKADAMRIREIEAITGQKVKPTAAGARAGKEAGARVRATAKKGKVADTLRAGLRELAQSDARTAREMAAIVRDATPKVAGAKGSKAIRGGRGALPAEKPTKLAASNRPTRAKGSRTTLPRTPGTVAKPRGLKPSPVSKEAAKPMKAAVQFRSRKQAAKAYKLKTNTLGNKTAASIGFNAAIERRDAFANSAPRLVFRRGKNQQITLSGGVETVRTGKMKQVGERVKGGSIRRSKAKPGPMAGSRSWKKNVERQMKSGGVVDPWLKAAYERRYGKSR